MRNLLIALALTFTIGGCGAHPLEAIPVSRRFQELHQCPAPSVRPDGFDRWVVEGCGIRGRYTCLAKYDTSNAALLGGETCIEETREEIGVEVAGGTENERDVEAPTEDAGVVTSAARMPGGWLVLQGHPRLEPGSVNVRYRTQGAGSGACELLLVDGESTNATGAGTNRETKADAIEHLFRLDANVLARLAQSRRVAGRLCGEDFVLDKLAHARARAFAVRFLELRATSVPDARAQSAN